jgi:hypothetical protein
VTGQLSVTVSGTTPLSGTNLPLALINADVPATAPYSALDVLKVTNVAVTVQSGATTAPTVAIGDTAIHKNTYLGDADGNGIYTGFDSALVARTVVGLDTGFDAHSWTDPVIVADVVGTGKLTGIDTTLITQKSVSLPTPQIPNLPGIPLVPNGGGGSVALDEPQTASINVVSNPAATSAVFATTTVSASTTVTSTDAVLATNAPRTNTSIRSAAAQIVFAADDGSTDLSPPRIHSRSDYIEPFAARPAGVSNGSANNQAPLGATSALDDYFAAADRESPAEVERNWLDDDAADDSATDDCFDLIAD